MKKQRSEETHRLSHQRLLDDLDLPFDSHQPIPDALQLYLVLGYTVPKRLNLLLERADLFLDLRQHAQDLDVLIEEYAELVERLWGRTLNRGGLRARVRLRCRRNNGRFV